uniref:ABC transporter permease n=1 Tax=Ndongobacter massiliensis TaxID=1871025 RepID=UPI000931295C|nr:ABC transporter permease [Ndongobacter massiliensis]
MGKTVLKICLRMGLLLFLVSLLSFILIVKAPIDPMQAYVGAESTLSEEAKADIAEYWGFNDPLPQRYLNWVGHMLQGDLGQSVAYKKPVSEVIGERVSYSLALMAFAWVVSGILGYALGLYCGTYEGSVGDRLIRGFCLLLQSAPTYWIGLLALSFFAVYLGWFPFGMAVPAGKLAQEVTFWDRLRHFILPALTLSIVSIGKIVLYTRQKVGELRNSDFILFARARGESDREILRRHLLRNTALPAITLQCASFSELFGGMALAETVFAYPGIGTATTKAALSGDVPLLLGIALFSACFVFVGNLAANLLYGIVDPRVREGGAHV